MESEIEYRHPCSIGGLLIRHQINNERSNNTTISPSSLPTLAIQFHLNTDEQFWYTLAPHEPPQFQGQRSHIKSLRDLTLPPFVYMSYDMFYSAMQSNLNNWGEEFDRNYRHVVIRDMIGKVREIVDDESNKGCRILKVFVSLTLVIDHYSDERSLMEGLSPHFNGMVPARKSSIMELPERMEIDEDERINDDCVICIEELGKDSKILCMPCSHMFHGECITTWLEKSHLCPICRYEMPTAHVLDC